MSKARYETADQKAALQVRAQMEKPNVSGVIATSQGWSIQHLNGTFEVLVSFPGLDALLNVSNIATTDGQVDPDEHIQSA